MALNNEVIGVVERWYLGKTYADLCRQISVVLQRSGASGAQLYFENEEENKVSLDLVGVDVTLIQTDDLEKAAESAVRIFWLAVKRKKQNKV